MYIFIIMTFFLPRILLRSSCPKFWPKMCLGLSYVDDVIKQRRIYYLLFPMWTRKTTKSNFPFFTSPRDYKTRTFFYFYRFSQFPHFDWINLLKRITVPYTYFKRNITEQTLILTMSLEIWSLQLLSLLVNECKY